MPPRLPTLKPASPEALAFGSLWASLLDFGVVVMALVAAVNLWAPPQDLPWKPLSLDEPLGMATAIKFARATDDPELCRKILQEGGVAFVDQPVRTERFCTTENSVRVTSGLTRLAPAGPTITCPVALGYAFWSRHVLQPAAQETLGARVTQVDHYGSYSCRNVYGRESGRPSEHARANALDVAGFRLSDGRRITVAGDFRREDERGAFLRRVRDDACGFFHGVLSPDYNAAHRDHLHLDFGPYRICR
ncbi:extensin family protein [Phenylobacterium deserti]|uniref:Extensin family protein n=1 Tax=Phenylobacterium deserti TaxID=1914756 RepID=A0A328ARR9_9CAUL|nr:extensin family protein [Phenylobacterium deserti]RAK57650.1 extensin family protein [Phenylobacterium deserti]